MRNSVTVVEVSTTIRIIPSEVPLRKREGPPKRCVAKADTLVAIPKTWLDEHIGSLGTEKQSELDTALRFSLGRD